MGYDKVVSVQGVTHTLDLEKFANRAKYKFKGSTLKRKLQNLKLFDRFLSERGLELNEESIAEFMDYLSSKGYTPGSIRNAVYDVKSYCDLMLLDVDFSRIRELIPPFETREAGFLSEEEVRKLISAARQPFKSAIALMYLYCRRPGEVLGLKWSDIDFVNKRITFPILKKRRGREETATFQLSDWIATLLRQLPKEGEYVFPFSQKYFNKHFRKLSILVIGRRASPHLLRHSAVTHLRRRGVPIDVVSKYIARHSRIETTMKIYRHITAEEVREIPSLEEVVLSCSIR